MMIELKELLKSFRNPESTRARIFLFLFKTILFYLIFNYFFLAFQGMTTMGGTLYSPFIFEHFDFIRSFRRFLLWGGAQFASLIGYPSGYNHYNLFVYGGSGVRMVYSCLGFSLMSAYAALILAWPSKWFHQAISLAAGLVIIILLNIVRLGGLAVLYSTGHNGFLKIIDHHTLFNIIVLIVAFLMFALHIKYAESKKIDGAA
jgi:exosortase/archaeosortase family protein